MSETSSQLLCDVGRPCPNFQRLIEYVESVEEVEGAAGDSHTDLSRGTSSLSPCITRWNPRTSRLRINPYTFRNPCSRRRPKFRDESSTEMKEYEARVLQRKQEEPRQHQDKPIVKIKPNSSSTNPGTIQAARLDVELSRLLTQYGVSASDIDRRLQQISQELNSSERSRDFQEENR